MIENYKKELLENNKIIRELKKSIKKYYNQDVDISPVNIENIDNIEDLKRILEIQIKDIGKLNIIMEILQQNLELEFQKKIEKLKSTEKDITFSNFYRTGYISVNGIDVSVDRFYIKEVENNGKITFNFICTDNRIDKKIFKTIKDKTFEVKNIYPLKRSKTFYEIYLDKRLFNDNKIVLDNDTKLNLFLNHIKNWTKVEHKMVAETMI